MQRFLSRSLGTIALSLLMVPAAFANADQGENSALGVHHNRRGFAIEELTELLGMTKEELRMERDSGKTIREIAEEQGVDESVLKELRKKPRHQKPPHPINFHDLSQKTGISVKELQEKARAHELKEYLKSLGFTRENLRLSDGGR